MALATTPMITSGTAPPCAAALNTANLLTKPLVSGMPANDSRNPAKVSPATGNRRPSPAHCASSVTSEPSGPRTVVRNAKAPIVVKLYAAR